MVSSGGISNMAGRRYNNGKLCTKAIGNGRC